MKTRLIHKAYMALTALALTLFFGGLIAPQSDMYIYIACSIIVVYLFMIAPNVIQAYLPVYWAESAESDNGVQYPVRAIECKANYASAKDIPTRLIIAGVEVEVTQDHDPSMFGLPPHVSHVVHLEDCMLLSDEDLLSLLNDLFKTEYTL